MRMTASWSGSNDPTAYKSVARRCAPWRAPLGSSTDRQTGTDPSRSYAKARLAVHHRSACSGVKALRNTSGARRQAAKLCYRFGPLTPSARSANLTAGDGTKNGFPAPNKEPATNQNDHLTGKAPYRFESCSLQRRVSNEPCARDLPGRVLRSEVFGGDISSKEAFQLGFPLVAPRERLDQRLLKRTAGIDAVGLDRQTRALLWEPGAGAGEVEIAADQVHQIGTVGAVEHGEGWIQREGAGATAGCRSNEMCPTRAAARPRDRRLLDHVGSQRGSVAARRVISSAARRVNVNSNKRRGSAPPRISRATRCASVLVLPVPAPAARRLRAACSRWRPYHLEPPPPTQQSFGF